MSHSTLFDYGLRTLQQNSETLQAPQLLQAPVQLLQIAEASMEKFNSDQRTALYNDINAV